MFGVSLFNADGVCCYGTNTYMESMEPERLDGDVEITFTIESLDLVEGTYKLDWRSTSATGIPTTTTGCCTHSESSRGHTTSGFTGRVIAGRSRQEYGSERTLYEERSAAAWRGEQG